MDKLFANEKFPLPSHIVFADILLALILFILFRRLAPKFAPPPPEKRSFSREARGKTILITVLITRVEPRMFYGLSRGGHLNRINSGTLEADNFPRRYISRRVGR